MRTYSQFNAQEPTKNPSGAEYAGIHAKIDLAKQRDVNGRLAGTSRPRPADPPALPHESFRARLDLIPKRPPAMSQLFKPDDYRQKATRLAQVLHKAFSEEKEPSVRWYQRMMHFFANYGRVEQCENIYPRLMKQAEGHEHATKIQIQALMTILMAIRKRAKLLGVILDRFRQPSEEDLKLRPVIPPQDEQHDFFFLNKVMSRQAHVARVVDGKRTKARRQQLSLAVKAKSIASQLEELPAFPRKELSNLMLTVYSATGQWEEYQSLLTQAYGIHLDRPADVDIPDYQEAALSESSAASWMDRFFGKMPSRAQTVAVPTTRTLNGILASLGKQGRLSEMVAIFETMTLPLSMSKVPAVVPDVVTYNHLVRFALQTGKGSYHLAIHYLDMLREKARAQVQSTGPWTSFTTLDNYAQIFRPAIQHDRLGYAQAVRDRLEADLESERCIVKAVTKTSTRPTDLGERERERAMVICQRMTAKLERMLRHKRERVRKGE